MTSKKYVINYSESKEDFHLKQITDERMIKKIIPSVNLDKFPGSVCYFFYLGDKLIGYVFLQSPNDRVHPILEEKMNGMYYVWGVYIFEQYRGKGYSHQMLTRLLDDKKAYFLQVQKDNIVAIKSYLKEGFECYKESMREGETGKMVRYVMIRKKRV